MGNGYFPSFVIVVIGEQSPIPTSNPALQPREAIEESALHSGHLAAPRFAQYCHTCLYFADSSIVSFSGKKIVLLCRVIR